MGKFEDRIKNEAGLLNQILSKESEIENCIRALNNNLVELTMLNAQFGREPIEISEIIEHKLCSQKFLDDLYTTFSKVEEAEEKE